MHVDHRTYNTYTTDFGVVATATAAPGVHYQGRTENRRGLLPRHIADRYMHTRPHRHMGRRWRHRYAIYVL